MNTFRSNRKLYLLAALLFVGGIASAQVTIKGTVYGGGEGIRTNEKTGSVTGNTSVTMNGGTVVQSLYGGGEFGSVGTFTDTRQVVYNAGEENELRVDVPTKCQDETGLAKVIINGGKIGFFKKAKMPEPGTDTWGDSYGYIFAGGRGDADSINYPKAIACAVVDSTYLEINDGVFITASIYGGCENGLLLGNSHVKVKGGQIGVGYYKTNGVEHLDSTSFYQSNYESLWTTAINAIRTGDSTAIANSTAPFHECHAWPFGNANNEYLVYDIFADSTGYNSQGGSLNASDGNTFFGKVYGGGSGYYPFWDSVNRTAVWRRSAGRVIGNTLVEIEGGHILTAVFGGNEMTDVVGTAIVKMSGGTVGVPQLVSEIEQHPLNSHIFGAGLGDQRTRFNQWTNVDSTYVYITGGAVFGSVFGGGQDGHVLRNACVIVKDSIPGNDGLNPLIGTWGYTTFDGNVFGAGRGYSGIALTAGSVGGNTEVNIKGGTMLGSVYGGGRLASVGTLFVAPDDPDYGKLKEDDEDGTYGYTIVNLTGGTIGNRFEIESDSIGNYVGGNVYGGSKGRLTLLDGTTNPRWEDMGKVKQTLVSVNDTTAIPLVIKGHVFGGGEIGRVEKNTLVDIDKGSIGTEVTVAGVDYRLGGNVYGGGKGTPIEEKAGLVKGNAYVDMSNGFVQRSIYGGGEFGSVGTFTEYYTEAQGDHFVGEPKTCEEGTGLASVIVRGGQVGLSQALMPTPGTDAVDDDFGYIFAGSRGVNDPVDYPKANILAVVDTTYLEINDGTYLISGDAADQTLVNASVYGGCENGLVLRDTKVLIAGGQIGNGHWKDSDNTHHWDGVYPESQWNTVIAAITAENPNSNTINTLVEDFNECDAWEYGGNYLIYDIFAGTSGYDSQGGSLDNPTDGNSYFGNVFGGGSGYYPYAPGLWRRTAGRVYGNTNVEITGGHILTSVYGGGEISDVMQTSSVIMSGGTVGVPQTIAEISAHPLNSHVFGGGKGDSRPLFDGWTIVDSTNVYITGGVVFGSVFGGGGDGHVVRNTAVVLEDGTTTSPHVGTWGTTSFDGNVYGGGRGFIGNNAVTAGVGGNTDLTMEGGRVFGSVFGGGHLASVGIQLTGDNAGQYNNDDACGHSYVNIYGGNIGSPFETKTIEEHCISGNVYGGGKGTLTKADLTTMNPHWPSMGRVKQTEVNINGSDVVIKGDVFGGGEYGTVRDSTLVVVSNGTLMRDLFGGGYGSTSTDIVTNCDSTNMTPVMIAGRVYGRTDATVSGGLVKHNVYGGGEYAKVGIDVNEVTTIRQSTVSLNGGIVGSHDSSGNLFGGMVYGGGMGILADTTVAMVLGDTYIYDTLSNNNTPAHVLGHIYGGGEKALVQQHTNLTLGSLEVGTLADATETVTKTLPNGSSVTLYQTRALEGGRVFGGGQGVEDVNYRNAALVMGNTNTEVTGTAKVYGSVYGGGELANVGSGTLDDLDNDKNTGSATVTISGGTIGPLNGSQRNGNVFGGGKGLEELPSDIYYATVDSTHVVIKTGANIAGSVFGGGANGRVLGNASTDIQGGTIGTTGLTTWDGNVFGGGRNFNAYANTMGAVFGNVDIQMSDGTIKGNMYGGGRFGSVGMNYNTYHTSIDTITGTDNGYVNINITGGVVGDEYVQYLGTYNPSDESDDMPRTGFVFGGGRGIMDTDKIDKLGNVKGTTVTVGGDALVKSSVYGGSERGIIYKNTFVEITDDAQIGEASETMALHRGDVYGGGCGYDSIASGSTYVFLPLSGMVYGNTNVLVTGGFISRNVYGGGNLSSVGVATEEPVNGVYKTGLAKVTITSGTVGFSPDEDNLNGMVFGSARGRAGELYKDFSMVKNTEVVITGDAQVKGSVFGSGQDGHTRLRTNVLVGDSGEYTSNGLVIGTSGATGFDGNVYGGGLGLDKDDNNNYSSTAGIVGISTTTLVNNGTVLGSVFGGGRLASVGYDHVLDTTNTGTIIWNNIPADYGKATVTVTGTATIGSSTSDLENGNVFGSGKGSMGTTFANLSYVNETEVLVNGSAKVYGSVFGGGEDGHVRACLVSDYPEDTIKPGNTHVTIAESAIIGDQSEQTSAMKGNVYGGGRGLDKDHQGNTSPTAGVVEGNTKVDILNGTIWRSVFGGGNESVVKGQKVTNVVDGTIHADVHGGSNAIPVTNATWAHSGLKTVNVRGGHVMGDVYGCSHSSNDGEITQSQANAEKWTAFVNISGGQIDQDVYGAGYAGLVNGSVCVNIGKDAILNAPNHTYNVNYNKPHTGNWDQTGAVEPTAAMLVIGGSVYGGSDYYGSTTTNDWSHYDLTGYSLIFIDGTGYETTSTDATATNYMNIGGGLFGSGTHTESGQLGRHILLKDYGTRNETDGEMTSATRTLTTIQRSGNVVIDHANVNLIGIADISNAANENHYGVMRVSDTLAVINAGGIVLGDTTAELKYAHMDSIFSVQSLKLVGNNASIYDHNLYELKKNTWYWLGIQDEQNDANLYYISGTGANAQVMGSALDFEAENVVLYNDTSKLWVRYHEKKSTDTEYKQYYGELLGFFRMRGDEYHPINIDTVSFAYARPKITDDDVLDDENRPDGGWLSYNTDFNYFTDLGDAFTFTQQYPYINVLDYSKNDREDYRMWVDKSRRRCWYVDGTRGWGRDDKKKLGDDSGLYPDKPKYTLYGKNANGDGTGIVNEVYTANSRKYLNYSHKDDVIYVVGAISAEDEKEMLRDSTYTGDETHYRLKLYRYPGGHIMSNGKRDYGGAKTAIWGQPNGEEGDDYADYRGPGANYGAMLNVQGSENVADAASLEMRGVLMDGLYAYTEADSLFHEINDPSLPEASKFKPELDSLPLVLTHQNSTLTMHGGTILKRGYNNQNALDWYTDSDYKSYSSSGTPIYNGGAIFVDSLAIVNVSGLDSIVGNKQYLEFEGQTGADIECNAFLPTFATHLNITDTLDVNTKIGITSPIRNADPTYKSNTLSPVAVGVREGNVLIEGVNVSYASIDAHAAWLNNNFLDDLDWFFVNEYNTPDNERSTFYDNTLGWQELGVGNASKSLYFGWTWANVVRKAPEGFSYSNIDSPEDLAWLISKSAGLNRQTAIDFSNTGLIEQKKDIDLLQYVWVPVGDTVQGKAFKGSYDGRGHLITNLSIELLGKGDHRYERNNYGMFGYVDGGSIDRTFVVSGLIRPVGRAIERTDEAYNIGGLVGNLVGADALVTNSEAAVSIYCPDLTGYEYVAGGLVAKMDAGMVHSSMAMPIMTVGSNSGLAGGLVGSLLTGEVKNSFANSKFSFDDGTNQGFKAGGLLGHSGDNTVMQNCYSHWHDCVNLNQNNYSSIVVTTGHASIDSCYAMQNSTYDYTIDSVGTCGIYAPVISSDMLGYMYADNRVSIGDGNGKAYTADTTLFMVLNRWADYNKTSDIMYARWARPGIPEINGDLPVPMLYDDYDEDVNHQGDFRSVGTYAGGHVLQYGGPVRDGDDDEVDSALVRSKAGELDDYLFIYGDVNEIGTGLDITQGKVSIYEHAAILKAGSLANFDNTYVGVSFDNSKGSAMSTHGVNGMGIQELPRDWHMMSTPLRNAPLGFNYLLSDGTNTNNGGYIPGSIHGDYFNNPWAHHAEFSWLNGGDTGDNRYWMKGWTNSQITNGQSFNEAEWADGYFPSRLSSLHSFGEGCIEGADEYGRYPYGMDLYTWYEPEYHWINFKRNGPNHWHSDETATCQHEHISYYGNPNQYLNPNYLDKNEEFLISGKGYMASITVPTMLQSHGKMNAEDLSIKLTEDGEYCTGWNLVGNPYHGYLDFEAFATNTANQALLAKEETNPFYVIYNADGYTNSINDYVPESAFIYYVHGGSENGAYASQYLHPHQAFFVKMDPEEPNTEPYLQFVDGDDAGGMVVSRSDGETPFREWRPNYPLVNLFLSSDNGCTDVTVVEFERPEWGGATKLKELRSGNGQFYGYHEGRNYAALFAKEGTERVPLWFEAKEDDIFKMKWNTANGDFSSLFLIDNLTGVQYDMLANDSYIFEGHKDDYYSRFYIVFSVTGIEEELEGDDNFAFFDGSEWIVTGEGELDLIDLQGRVLWHDRLTGGQSRKSFPILAKSMYLLRLVNSHETKVQKIIVH